MEDKKIKVKFYFLCIVGRLHNDYTKISSEIRNKIDNISLGDNKLLSNTFEQEGDKDDYESWYVWKGKIPIKINNSTEDCDIIIKHFKVRLIIEVTRVHEDKGFVSFFKNARVERELLKQNDLLKNIFEIRITNHVEKIYSYPLIHIFKEYKSTDFNDFGDESISSFSYEVPDARRENVRSLLFGKPKKTIVRVSRPSIIATKMSFFMLSQIINSVYDTCLASLRKNHLSEPSEEIFHDMRDYVGRVLFDHEETVAGAELTRSVNTLSIIMSIGAIAAVLAIIYIFSDDLKSWAGVFLFMLAIIILLFFLRSKMISRWF